VLTQNQALAALLCLYEHVIGRPLARVDGVTPAACSRRVPVVLSQREVRALLDQLRDPPRLCVRLMYGSGLRLLECLSLRAASCAAWSGERLPVLAGFSAPCWIKSLSNWR
jgi:site-specific recombinase XerD